MVASGTGDTGLTPSLFLTLATTDTTASPYVNPSARGVRLHILRESSRVLLSHGHSLSPHAYRASSRRFKAVCFCSRITTVRTRKNATTSTRVGNCRKESPTSDHLIELAYPTSLDKQKPSSVIGRATIATGVCRRHRRWQCEANPTGGEFAALHSEATTPTTPPPSPARLERTTKGKGNGRQGIGKTKGGRNKRGASAETTVLLREESQWQDAPKAASASLYDMNMQLAAYAKDAQWEKAVVLLKQALAWSDSQSKASVGPADGPGGNGYRDGASITRDDSDVQEQMLAEPNVVSFNNVITACANAKKQKRAEGIFREMTKARGLQPNVFTYGALISACAKRGNWEGAVNYLKVYDIYCQARRVDGD